MNTNSWIRSDSGGRVSILLFVQPGASRTEVVGIHNERLKIKLAAPPVDGRANEELMRFIKKRLGIKSNMLELTAGMTSRSKTLQINGASVEEIENKLLSKK